MPLFADYFIFLEAKELIQRQQQPAARGLRARAHTRKKKRNLFQIQDWILFSFLPPLCSWAHNGTKNYYDALSRLRIFPLFFFFFFGVFKIISSTQLPTQSQIHHIVETVVGTFPFSFLCSCETLWSLQVTVSAVYWRDIVQSSKRRNHRKM